MTDDSLQRQIDRLNPPQRFDLPGGVLVRKRDHAKVVARYGPDGKLAVEPQQDDDPAPSYPTQIPQDAEPGLRPYNYLVVVYEDEPAYEIYKQAVRGDVQAMQMWAVIREQRLNEAFRIEATNETSKPTWNRDRGELSLDGDVIKRVRSVTVAKNVTRILDTFEDDGWPDRIDDPLDPSNSQMRLHEAIKRLNDNLTGIKFRADGTGQGIVWERI